MINILFIRVSLQHFNKNHEQFCEKIDDIYEYRVHSLTRVSTFLGDQDENDLPSLVFQLLESTCPVMNTKYGSSENLNTQLGNSDAIFLVDMTTGISNQAVQIDETNSLTSFEAFLRVVKLVGLSIFFGAVVLFATESVAPKDFFFMIKDSSSLIGTGVVNGVQSHTGNSLPGPSMSGQSGPSQTLKTKPIKGPKSVTVISSNISSTVSKSRSGVYKSSMLDFTLRRVGYDALSFFTASASEFLKYDFLDGYSAVIEPHAAMELYFLVDDSSIKSYNYTICRSNSASRCYSGYWNSTTNQLNSSYAVIGCHPYDEYVVSVSIVMSNSSVLYSEINAMCMYVRRDIESLTADDLALTMDTMYEIWWRGESEGRELYGKNYHRYGFISLNQRVNF